MSWNKLLEKQIRKYLPEEFLGEEKLQPFLQAVDSSYGSFERDISLSAHAFRISEQEYAEIYERLKEEVRLKKIGIKNLKLAIRNVEEETAEHPVINADEDNLIDALTYLNEQLVKRLEAEKELKRLAIVASANENGILLTDVDGTISWANEGFTRLTGYSMEEVIGKTPVQLLRGPLSDRHALREMVADFTAGRNFSVEVAHYRKDGSWFWGKAKGQSITDEQGNIIRYFAMVEDISRQKQLEAALIEAKEQAEESSRAKETFLANMSHEIRTPMNAILNMGRQLNKTTLSGNQQKFLKTMNAAAESLLVVINDILDISKIEAGKLAIERIAFDLEEVVNRVMRVMGYKAEEKGLNLTRHISRSVHSILFGDPHRLYQVLMNLVSNAVKFTPKGSVAIECSLIRQHGNQQEICLKVIDTGIGMDQDFVERMYQKFLQEDKSVARKYGGTGLGMSISKQLVELMNGTISVSSRKGRGTEVSVRIPFDRAAESDLPVAEKELTDSGILRGSRILLAEDNEMNRLVARTILENYQAAVYEVINGAEAVGALQGGQYDIVLMDVQMPVMDGLEATRIIRERVNKTIPVIAVTANAIRGETEKCMAAGMNGYISKPFDEKEFIEVIAHWLDHAAPAPGASAASPPQSTPVPPATTNLETAATMASAEAHASGSMFDLKELREIGRGKPAFVRKMVGLFLAQVPQDGQDMQNAYQAGDFDKVRFIAHRSRPMISSIGIGELKEDIREIEKLAHERRTSPHLEQLIGKFITITGIVAGELRVLYESEDSGALK